ncbi:MAG: tandem-95 repeat protein, partial [Pseudomonadales bacterium]|nr:tandem-95 repeat protein [Pseudomonadales bacterium]
MDHKDVAEIREYQVADPVLLFDGTYTREGFDLVITGPDGAQLVISDYFSFQPPPNLMVSDAIGLTPDMVRGLLHEQFDETQYAGPAGGSAAEVIGTVKLIFGKVYRIDDASQEQTLLKKGDLIYKFDEIQVDGRGFFRAEMSDGSRVNLGRDSRATFDDYAFNETARTGLLELSVVKGGFSYKSGLIGTFAGTTRDHTKISTPSAIISVRGSELEGRVDASSGQTIVIHKSGILRVTDINGDNPVVLDTPGNTAIILNGVEPLKTIQATPQQQDTVQQALPPTNAKELADQAEVEAESDAEKAGAEEDKEDKEDDKKEQEDKEAEEEQAEKEPKEEESLEEQDEKGEKGEKGENSDKDGVDPDKAAEENLKATDESQAEGEPGPEGESGPVDEPESTPPETVAPESEPGFRPATTAPETLGPEPDIAGPGIDDPVVNEPKLVAPPIEVEPVPTVEEELPFRPDTPPTTEDAEFTLVEGSSLQLASLLLANSSDPDGDQQLVLESIDSESTVGSLTFDAASQQLVYTADAEVHNALGQDEPLSDSFSFTVRSGNSTASGQVTLNIIGVNDLPVANDDSFSVDENAVLSISAENGLLANDTDPDNPLQISSFEVVSGDDVNISIDNDGGFQFSAGASADQLNTGESQTTVINYTASSGEADEANATLTITINGENDAPLGVDDTASTFENDVLTIQPLVNDTDPESQSLSISSIQVLGAGTAVIANDGQSIDYTPASGLAAGEVAADEIVYTLSDGSLTDQASIVITITGQNSAPIISQAAGQIPVISADAEDVLVDLLATVTDDSESLTVISLDDTSTLGLVSLTGVFYNPNGQFISLNTGDTATDRFLFTVEDTEGLTATGEFQLTVSGVADAPIAAAPISLTLTEDDGSTSLDLLTNITDPDQGDSLTVANLTSSGDFSGITIVDNIASIDPLAYAGLVEGSSEVIALNYDVIDSTGLSVAHSANITIEGADDAPVTTSVTLTVNEDESIVFTSADFSFVDSDSGDTLQSIFIVAPPLLGRLEVDGVAVSAAGQQISVAVLNSALLTFNPDPDDNGASYASFSYSVSDGSLDSNVAVLTIDVSPVNDAPVAVDDVFTTSINTALTTTAGLNDLLLNDSDVDLDTLTVVTAPITDVSNGSLSILANGVFTYTPDNGFVGTDSFVYQIQDGNGGTANATVNITVENTGVLALTSGDFSDPTIWSSGLVPVATDSIDIATGVTVDKTVGSDTVSALAISNTGAQLKLAGGDLIVTNGVNLGPVSTVAIEGNTLSAGSLSNDGAIALRAGTIMGGLFSNQGSIEVEENSSSIDSAGFSSAGSLSIQGTSTTGSVTLNVVNGFTNTGSLTLDNLHTLSRTETLNVSSGPLLNSGTIFTTNTGGGGGPI